MLTETRKMYMIPCILSCIGRVHTLKVFRWLANVHLSRLVVDPTETLSVLLKFDDFSLEMSQVELTKGIFAWSHLLFFTPVFDQEI